MHPIDISIQFTMQALHAMPGVELEQIAAESGLDRLKLELNCKKLFKQNLIEVHKDGYRVIERSMRADCGTPSFRERLQRIQSPIS